MTLVRRFARPMLAATFFVGASDTFRNPESRVETARGVTEALARRLPFLPQEPAQLVRLNAGVQLGAASMLALSRFPRLSALVLATSLVPTTLAGHRFWEEEDRAKRKAQRLQLTKNLSILGGLLLAVVDTEARPGLAWRARHASTLAAGRAIEKVSLPG